MDLKKIKKALAAADRIAAEEIQLERKRSGLAIRKLTASREMLKTLGCELEKLLAPPPKVKPLSKRAMARLLAQGRRAAAKGDIPFLPVR